MIIEEEIMLALKLLLNYVEKEDFKGYDPYDGLTSPLFRLPFLKSNHHFRFIAQQAIKRSPVNLRPMLGIRRSVNPVSLGLGLQAYAYLYSHHALPSYKEKADVLIDKLVKLIPKNYEGACWGYDFPWEARYASIPAYQPTVVATGIITNSLYIAYQTFKNEKARDLVLGGCEFVTSHLNRSEDADGSFCFSYSPFDHEKVFNASMKGSRLLSQGYHLTKNESWKNLADNSVKWVMKYQSSEGAWIYSKRNSGGWVDNYHTAYILDCLHEYIQCSGELNYQVALQKGINYYLTNFLTNDGQPKFYNNEKWPADCTAAGQTILSLVRFNQLEKAKQCAIWMIRNMQSEKGSFYFRKYRHHIEKVSFMRWSDTWMLAGLSYLVSQFNSVDRQI